MDQISRIREVRIGNGLSVPFGCEAHLKAVEWVERRDRESRAVAVPNARAEADVTATELRRLEGLAAEAKAEASELGLDPEVLHFRRVRYADVDLSAARCRRQLEVAHEAIEKAKTYAKSPLPVSVDGVRRERARILDELGLTEEVIRRAYVGDGHTRVTVFGTGYEDS